MELINQYGITKNVLHAFYQNIMTTTQTNVNLVMRDITFKDQSGNVYLFQIETSKNSPYDDLYR